MADEYKDVRRVQSTDRAELEVTLKTKMLGVTNDANPSLGYKKSSGDMLYFTAEGGDATYDSLAITGLATGTNQNIGIDDNGNVILLAGDSSLAEVLAVGNDTEGREIISGIGGSLNLGDNLDTHVVLKNDLNGVNIESAYEVKIASDTYVTTQAQNYVTLQTTNGNINLQQANSASQVVFYNSGYEYAKFGVSEQTLPFQTIATIDAEPTGKQIVTREYVTDATTNLSVDHIDFDTTPTTTGYLEGRTFYNNEKTLQLHTDIEGVRLEMGRTMVSRFVATEPIAKGKVCYVPTASAGVAYCSVASADTYNENWVLGVAANSANTGEVVEFMQKGVVEGVNTSALTEGIPLYLGLNGAVVDVRPDFPQKAYLIGTIVYSDAINGVIGVNMNLNEYDYAGDGCVIEDFTTSISVVAGVIKLTLANSNPSRLFVPFQLGSEVYEITSPVTVDLIEGTSTVPQNNYTYLKVLSGVPTLLNSVSFPTGEFVMISDTAVLDDLETLIRGALSHQKFYSAEYRGGRGRFSYISERLFRLPAHWDSGCTPTATINTVPNPDVLGFSTLAGVVYLQSRLTFPALNIATDGIYVVNGVGGAGNIQPYTRLTNLIFANEDTNGNLLNNNRLHLVVFGLINNDTNQCKLCVNLPTGGYSTNDTQAYYDYNGTSVYTVPQVLGHTAFLIARIPVRNTGTGIEFINPVGQNQIINLLGNPIGISGGASGSGAFIPNLTQVLGAGADATDLDINNLDNLDVRTIAVNDPSTIAGQVEIKVNTTPVGGITVAGTEAGTGPAGVGNADGTYTFIGGTLGQMTNVYQRGTDAVYIGKVVAIWIITNNTNPGVWTDGEYYLNNLSPVGTYTPIAGSGNVASPVVAEGSSLIGSTAVHTNGDIEAKGNGKFGRLEVDGKIGVTYSDAQDRAIIDTNGNGIFAYELKQQAIPKFTIQKDGSASLPDCVDDDINDQNDIMTLSKSFQIAGRYRASSDLNSASVTLLKTDNGRIYNITASDAIITITLDSAVITESWFDFTIPHGITKQIGIVCGTQTFSIPAVQSAFRVYKYGENDARVVIYSPISEGGGVTSAETSSSDNAVVAFSGPTGNVIKARTSTAYSVLGNSSGSISNPADITASLTNTVLWRDGGTLGFSALNGSALVNASITDNKLVNMTANTIKGRLSGTGVPSNLTGANVNTILPTFTTTLKGLVPAPTTVSGKVLSDNGTWIVPSSGGGSKQNYNFNILVSGQYIGTSIKYIPSAGASVLTYSDLTSTLKFMHTVMDAGNFTKFSYFIGVAGATLGQNTSVAIYKNGSLLYTGLLLNTESKSGVYTLGVPLAVVAGDQLGIGVYSTSTGLTVDNINVSIQVVS